MRPPTLVIAEAGVNHNGSLETALQLVDAAADAGADVVKFQSFNSASLATAAAGRAQYQKDNMQEDGSQLDMLRQLELDEQAHQVLHEHCATRNIEFLSTAFDFDSLNMLLAFNPSRIKVPSGDLTFARMLLKVGRARKPIILSTGMATLEEIEHALAVLAYGLTHVHVPNAITELKQNLATADAQEALQEYVTILHCVTQYPCPPEMVNLAAMDSIRARFELPVGYSDHSLGIAVPIAAVARGATIIEKHLTLDCKMAGPDHAASLEPGPFREMVRGIREVALAIGDGVKAPTAQEVEVKQVARRSLIAARPIKEGSTITVDDLTAKRPGNGLSPMLLWDIVGETAGRSYATDDLIEWK
jgi:N-acetylneuraminate synthase